jgi:hypothetical protein
MQDISADPTKNGSVHCRKGATGKGPLILSELLLAMFLRGKWSSIAYFAIIWDRGIAVLQVGEHHNPMFR